MKKQILLIALFILNAFMGLSAQRIITGKVISTDDNLPLVGASIVLKGTKTGTLTDINGLFSLKITHENMTLVIAYIGFLTKEVAIGTDSVFNISLDGNSILNEVVVIGYSSQRKREMTGAVSTTLSGRVAGISITKQTKIEPPSHEKYKKYDENGFKTPQNAPYSTFSIDVDKTAYTNARRYIRDGGLPPKDAVRIEEMINYFNYQLPSPTDKHPIAVSSELGICPWNKAHHLLKVDLQAQRINYDETPANNLVFLIDVSGSMQSVDKLELLKKAFKILTNQLREKDYVSIVTYAGSAGLVLEPTRGSNKKAILNALNKLEAGGSTAGGEGIELAYQVAEDNFISGGNNRVILASDGDFNVGVSSASELEALIEQKRENDIYLSVLGFGQGNYNDEGMETLADKGNGNYFYIDSEKEAEKVFTKELTGTIVTVARDVKFQIEFNPNLVQSYRLIGYENRHLNDEDFNNDKKDAGEMGAGNSVTALYEIVPKGVKSSENERTQVDTLRYQANQNSSQSLSNELVFVKLRYKKPLKFKSTLITQSILNEPLNLDKTSDNFRFAAAVAAFGQILRGSEYGKDFNLKNVLHLAEAAKGADTEGYRQEFIDLVQKAMHFK